MGWNLAVFRFATFSVKLILIIMFRFLIISIFSFNILNAQESFLKTDIVVANIDSDTTLEVENRTISGLSSEGGSLKIYYDDIKLCKLSVIIYGETGMYQGDYYYQNDSLLFVLNKTEVYRLPIYVDNSVEVKSSKYSKFYFSKGELIKWIENDSVISNVKTELAKKNAFELINDKRIFLEMSHSPASL